MSSSADIVTASENVVFDPGNCQEIRPTPISQTIREVGEEETVMNSEDEFELDFMR